MRGVVSIQFPTEEFGNFKNTLQRFRRHTLSDILRRTSRRVPEKFALMYDGQRLNYRELNDLVNQTARAFSVDGMEKGDRVAVMSKNSLDFVIVNFALAQIGAVMLPINYMLIGEDIEYILEHAAVSGFIASKEYASVLDASSNRLEIKHRYLMDVSTEEQLKDELERWLPLSVLRSGQSTDPVEVELDDDDLAHVLYT